MDEGFLFDSHMHTPLCHHAVGEPEEYAAEAVAKGLHGIIFTCHTPLPEGISPAVRMTLADLPRYVDLVARCREAYAGQLTVRLGLEVDYVPGHETFLEKVIQSQPFDYIIGSVHPHLPEIKGRFFTGDTEAFATQYFRLQSEAAATGLFDAMAHPDVIKIVSWARYDRERQWSAILNFLDKVANCGMALELNTSGLIRAVNEFHPAPAILPEIAGREIPVVLGSDAHAPGRVGESFGFAVTHLAESGVRMMGHFRQRERRMVALADWQEALTPALQTVGKPNSAGELRS